MAFTNKVYDVLKFIAQYLLPGAGTLYFALARIWGLPYGEEVVGTITAVDAFLGAMLGISCVNYMGDGVVRFGADSDDCVLELDISEEEAKDAGKITLKVEVEAEEN